MAVGGRVAEEIVYGTITTGAESDIQQLTALALLNLETLDGIDVYHAAGLPIHPNLAA